MNYSEALEALHERYTSTQDFAEPGEQIGKKKIPSKAPTGPSQPDRSGAMKQEKVPQAKQQDKQNQDAQLGAPDKPEGGRAPTPGGEKKKAVPQQQQQAPQEEEASPAEEKFLSVDMERKYNLVQRAKARLQGLKAEYELSDAPADKKRVYKMIIRQMIKMSDLM